MLFASSKLNPACPVIAFVWLYCVVYSGPSCFTRTLLCVDPEIAAGVRCVWFVERIRTGWGRFELFVHFAFSKSNAACAVIALVDSFFFVCHCPIDLNSSYGV